MTTQNDQTNYTGLILTNYNGNTVEVVSFLPKFNMYQVKETNKNGIVTNPLLSSEDVEKLAATQTKIEESTNKVNEINATIQQEEKEELEYESIGNFLINDPIQHGKAKKVLNATVRYTDINNKVIYTTRKEYVQSILDTHTVVEDKGRLLFVNKDTKVGTTATKTEVEYFYFLQDQKEETTEQTQENTEITAPKATPVFEVTKEVKTAENKCVQHEKSKHIDVMLKDLYSIGMEKKEYSSMVIYFLQGEKIYSWTSGISTEKLHDELLEVYNRHYKQSQAV